MCSVPQGSIVGHSQFTAHNEDVKHINPTPVYSTDDTQMLAKTSHTLVTCCPVIETSAKTKNDGIHMFQVNSVSGQLSEH